MDTEKILYLACSANQSSDSNWKSPPPLLLKAYTKLEGGDKDHPACERPVTLWLVACGLRDWESRQCNRSLVPGSLQRTTCKREDREREGERGRGRGRG